jgi:site-specific recombinase XerD
MISRLSSRNAGNRSKESPCHGPGGGQHARALCPATLIGARDRALLALGFAGAFRRSELVALQVEDLAPCADGLRVTVRRSKTDQEAQGQTIAILRGVCICPVEAVDAWLAKAGINTGFVFRSVLKGGRLGGPLPAQSVAHIVKAYATRAGLDARIFSGHSLRAGFCTSAAEHGASVWKMMDVSRHKSVQTLRGYVRNAESFKDHAGAAFL